MLLSELLPKLNQTMPLVVNGWDLEQHRGYPLFDGYSWQFIIGGHCEDAEINCISIVDFTLVVQVAIEFDTFKKGIYKNGLKLKK